MWDPPSQDGCPSHIGSLPVRYGEAADLPEPTLPVSVQRTEMSTGLTGRLPDSDIADNTDSKCYRQVCAWMLTD